MNYNLSDYFVLSSSCLITKGYNRSLIHDFSRNSSNLISNEYFDLIEYLDRKKIEDIITEVEDDSKNFFFEFLNFMFDNEYALFVNDIELFPAKSDELYDSHVILKDCIIEIDNNSNAELFVDNLNQLDLLNCENIQVWLKGQFIYTDIVKYLNLIKDFDFLCIELCLENSFNIDKNHLIEIIDKHASISKIFLFNSKDAYIYEYISEHKNQHPMLMGQIIYINHPLDANNCGVINFESLSFGVETQYKINKKFNGCLYKKLVIDSGGNIKNCPYITNKVQYNNLKEALSDDNFKKLWFIKKDEIEICKDCEFRYNCTDCRAFTIENNIYSKPKKCNYNPYTNVWN
jgi:SPASM domain peptide maturase of grasp-with-spasm system